MTVCLTGDVHHASLETRDQAYLDGTEMDAALEYAEIAATYDVPVTLFVTGKTATEEPEKVRRLAGMANVEVGGHNYYAFSTLAHKAARGLFRSWNGPRRFQSWEIGKTVKTFAELGIELRSWRDHAYRHDRHTASLLADHGITHFSDAVGPMERVRSEDGLTVVPINTPPDHEHVYHAFRTPEFVAEGDFEGPFGTESFTVTQWREWLLETVVDHESQDRITTILAHPACMKLADDFVAFRKLCSRLDDSDGTLISEVSTNGN